MKRSDLEGGAIFVTLGIVILLLTLQFPTLEKGHPGPSLFPRILAVLFISFGAIVFLRGVKGEKKGAPAEIQGDEAVTPNYFNPIFVLIIIGAYIVLSNWVGFYLTSTLLLFLLMIKLKVPYLRSFLISILLTLFVDFMFAKILRVPLPIGFWGF
jgi:putative tricarboxylic transport membrane protein